MYIPLVFSEIQLDTSSRGVSVSSSRMESKSGVVGKFRSHYNTIEQVTRRIKLYVFMKRNLQLSYQKLVKQLFAFFLTFQSPFRKDRVNKITWPLMTVSKE